MDTLFPPKPRTGASSNKHSNRMLAIDKHIDQDAVLAVMTERRRKAQLAAPVSNELSPDQAALLQEFILESLAYKSMHDREGEIAEAHRETFQWVFTKDSGPGANLVPWLKSAGGGRDGNIYWVGGKKGSGKSTLMRYVFEGGMTKLNLEEWAGKKKLQTAGFFFWISGSIEQRSQMGLLRSLLHQLLDSRRELMSETFPAIWKRYSDMTAQQRTQERVKSTMVWKADELMDGIKNYLKAATRDSKICLFVDGLDEFDGDHQDIIDFFVNITEHPNSKNSVKACLSSRAWPIFEKAFKDTPSLHLHDLTKDDMRNYIIDRFRKSRKVANLALNDHERLGKIEDQMIRKADGVFLWTIIVTKRMIEAVETGNILGLPALSAKIETIPGELDDLFRLILLQGKPFRDMQEASVIFQLLRAREDVCEFTGDESSSRLELWELALAQESRNKHALQKRMRILAESKALEICQYLKNCLNNECAGLLEVHDKNRLKERVGIRFIGEDESAIKLLTKSRVTYLHRTVKDFLSESGIWDELVGLTKNIGFDAHICLTKSYILQLKFPLEEPEQHRRLDEWWPSIALAMTHARYSDSTPAPELKIVLDELHKTQSKYWLQRYPGDPNDNWVKNAFGTIETRKDMEFHYPFVSLAAKFGLMEYVIESVRAEKIGYESGIPLLSYATEYLVDRRSSIFPLSDPELVKFLLEWGHNPNEEYTSLLGQMETPWRSCLGQVREAIRKGQLGKSDHDSQTQSWAQILRGMVESGADTGAVVLETRKDQEATATQIVERALEQVTNETLSGVYLHMKS